MEKRSKSKEKERHKKGKKKNKVEMGKEGIRRITIHLDKILSVFQFPTF